MASHQPLDHEGLQLHIHDDLQLTTPPTDPELLYEPRPTGHQHHPEFPPCKSPRITRVGGRRRSTFWLTLALAIVTIVAAVEAGFSGSLAVKSASRSSCPSPAAALQPTANQTANGTATQLPAPTSFATAALTNLSVPAPRTVVSLALDCPTIHGKSYTSATTGNTFMQWCDHDYPAGSAADGHNGTIKDIVAIIAYAMEDCMEACSNMNIKSFVPVCACVEFNPDMRSHSTGNCWLKNTTGPGKATVKAASAKLVSA